MSVTVSIDEANLKFAQLLARVISGEEVIIAKGETPVARMVPFASKPPRRVPGTAKGKVVIAPDFDAPLPQEILDSFEA